jgi:hypothetical protein
MIKRVFGDSVRSKTETVCRNEVLAHGDHDASKRPR